MVWRILNKFFFKSSIIEKKNLKLKELNFFLKKNLIIHGKKFKISCEFLIYTFNFYLALIWKYFLFQIKCPMFGGEIGSMLIAFLIAFFFYYLIVIELSILIFGYSLLCYGFAFILAFLYLIVSWGLEISLIKFGLSAKKGSYIPTEFWMNHYKNDTPFGFFDYLLYYGRYDLFHGIIIQGNGELFKEIGQNSFAFFFFLVMIFFYTCSYKYDPRFVNFAGGFFHPQANFWEVRGNPKIEDWYSAPIGTRAWWVKFLTFFYPDNKNIKWLIKITKPRPLWESWADWGRNQKTSLKSNTYHADVHFCGVIYPILPLRMLAFEVEQPMITADGFEPNWNLLFLGYMGSKFDNPEKKNFWTKHFLNDYNFWQFILGIQEPIKESIEATEQRRLDSIVKDGALYPSFYDALLYKNYLDDNVIITPKLHETGGVNGEFFDNIVTHQNIKGDSELADNVLASILTQEIVPNPYPNLTGLRSYHKKTSIKGSVFFKLKYKFYYHYYDFKFFKKKYLSLTLDELKKSLDMNIDIQFNFYKGFMEQDYGDNPDTLDFLTLKRFGPKRFVKLCGILDRGMTRIELNLGMEPWKFNFWDKKGMSWYRLMLLIERGIARIDIKLGDSGLLNKVKIKGRFGSEGYEFSGKYFKMSPGMEELREKQHQRLLKLKVKYRFPGDELLLRLTAYNQRLNILEHWAGLKKPELFHYYNSKKGKGVFGQGIFTDSFPKLIRPLGIRTIEYLGIPDTRLVMPGFIRYYSPTFYPSVFNTFGSSWFKYQKFKGTVKTSIISDSNNLATARNTTPLLAYTGVEAILYWKNVLIIFDFFINGIIKMMTYPIEIIVTSSKSIFSEFTWPLTFFLHITWFIHYYIYFFLISYIIFFIIKYYYYSISFRWLYEIMFETSSVVQPANLIYWHSLTDIWKNYRSPDHFIYLGLGSLLMLQYSLPNYLNYSVKLKLNIFPLLSVFYNHVAKNNLFIDFFKFCSIGNKKFSFILESEKSIYFFKLFFIIKFGKFNNLGYEGGLSCNFDSLVWSYFYYLEQSSIYISNGLIKNYFFKFFPKNLSKLIKQFTINISSMNLNSSFYFFSNPLLDTVLSGKLLINIFYFFEYNSLFNKNFLYKKFFFWNKKEGLILANSLLMEYKFFQFTLSTESLQTFYSLLNEDNSLFLSKLNYGNFWDNPKYWIFAFFGSFRFVPKTGYPFFNAHLSYEADRSRLSGVAYASSWIGQSMYVGPFFNLIQHIWWTSNIYLRARSLTDINYSGNFNLNSNIDQVGNFYEKRYNLLSTGKVETIFGLVRTLSLPENYKHTKLGMLKNPNNSFMESYGTNTPNFITTNRGYNKTNPPLNILELNITPKKLLNIFKHFSKIHTKLYLTFLLQLPFILKLTSTTNLGNEYDYLLKELDVSEDITKIDTSLFTQYDEYLKKFDFNLVYNKKNEFNNWIFGFDISFFFSHFTSWDYFTDSFIAERPKGFFNSTQIFSLEQLNLLLSFGEMNSELTNEYHWLFKPFGALDKSELFALRRYKQIKTIDQYSFTTLGSDPFINFDREHLNVNKGLAVQPMQNLQSSPKLYNENYFANRNYKFPFNLSIQKNIVMPITLGWVGSLLFYSLEILNLLFSFIYASSSIENEAWKINNKLTSYTSFFIFKGINFKTFFINSELNKSIFFYKKIFFWSNVLLHPTLKGYSFGPKASSRFDYWSWLSGMSINYKNGFYSYRPYLNFGHSFGNKLLTFDPSYGFYRSYGQFDDNIFGVDLDTDAMPKLFEEKSDNIFEDPDKEKIVYDLENPFDYKLIHDLAQDYGEYYYCFQHPYFIGYIVFWFFFFLNEEIYLGISNYSFGGLLIGIFLKKNNFSNKELPENHFFKGQSSENIYRKSMFGYGIYWMNSIQLSTNYFNLNENSGLTDDSSHDYMYNSYLTMMNLFYFFKINLQLGTNDFQILLDLKKINLNLLGINWLTLEMPFFINSYLPVINSWVSKNFLITRNFYDLLSVSYSHYDSLRETFNLTMFWDWSTGTYLDFINFSSYYSTFRSHSTLISTAVDNPVVLITTQIRSEFDESKEVALTLGTNYAYHDMDLGHGLLTHNFSIIHFFSKILSFSTLISMSFLQKGNFFNFLKFYFLESSLPDDFAKHGLQYTAYNGLITKHANKLSSQIFNVSMLWKFYRTLTYDSIMLWYSSGIFIGNGQVLHGIFESLKFRIFLKFYFFEKFYLGIGGSIGMYFFKK